MPTNPATNRPRLPGSGTEGGGGGGGAFPTSAKTTDPDKADVKRLEPIPTAIPLVGLGIVDVAVQKLETLLAFPPLPRSCQQAGVVVPLETTGWKARAAFNPLKFQMSWVGVAVRPRTRLPPVGPVLFVPVPIIVVLWPPPVSVRSYDWKNWFGGSPKFGIVPSIPLVVIVPVTVAAPTV